MGQTGHTCALLLWGEVSQDVLILWTSAALGVLTLVVLKMSQL